MQAQITRGNNSSVTWTCYACQQINNDHIIHAYGCISEENASPFDTINYPTCTQVQVCMSNETRILAWAEKLSANFFFLLSIFNLNSYRSNLWNFTTGSLCYTLFTPCAYHHYKSESKCILGLTFKRNSIHMHGWILTNILNSSCAFKCC